MQAWFERSLPVRAADAAVGALSRWLGRLLPNARPSPSLALGLCAAAALCVPHGYWNNLYGLLLAGLCLPLYWRDCARRRGTPLSVGALGPGVWCFLLVAALTTVWAASKTGALRSLCHYLTGFAMAYAVAGALDDRAALGRFFACLYAGLLLTALYGLYEYYIGQHPFTTLTTPTAEGGELLRLCATLENPNNYAEVVAMLLPPCLVWALTTEKKGRRALLTAGLLLPLAALALTYSRTGWAALAIALLLLAACRDWRLLLVLAAVGLLCLPLLPDSLRLRLLSAFDRGDITISRRVCIWRDCLPLLRQRWLTGVGLGSENFMAAFAPFRDLTARGDIPAAHSNMGYLEILLETGVFGFAAFCAFFFGILRRGMGALRRLRGSREGWLLAAVLAALAAMALAFVSEHVWFYPRVLLAWCLLYGATLALCRRAGSFSC